MYAKFEGQKIYTEKDSWNLLACVTEKFTAINYDTLPRVE